MVRVVEPALHPHSGEGGLDIQEIEKWETSRVSRASEYLENIAIRLKHEGTTIRSEVFVGKVTENLIDYAEKSAVDLIIIGTHGRSGVTRWVLGSVADMLLRSASVPVLMVRTPGAKGTIGS